MRPSIRRDILSYLVEHPDAQDTLEGIAEWWLLDRAVQRGISEVKDALGELAARDLVVEKKGPDSKVHYQVNHARLERIRDLLEQEEPDDG